MEYGDLDGDGVDEIALESESRFGRSWDRPQYLDIYRHLDGAWQRIWAANEDSLPRDGGVAGEPVLSSGVGVRDLRFVSFGGDQQDLLFTTGVLDGTDHSGEVWIASMPTGRDLSTEFYERVPGLGEVSVEGDSVDLTTSLYSS